MQLSCGIEDAYLVESNWIFKVRRGGGPFYVYLENEDAESIEAVWCQLILLANISRIATLQARPQRFYGETPNNNRRNS